jgi:hypothetical protein
MRDEFDPANFPFPQDQDATAAIQAAHRKHIDDGIMAAVHANPGPGAEILAFLRQVRRDIALPLLEEVGHQLEIARQPSTLDALADERARVRALLTALICAHTAMEAWLNRSLEDEHPVVWPEVDRMEFMAKVRLLAKLMKATPPSPARVPYDGSLDPGGLIFNGLQELNSLRNEFSHYKAKRVEMGSDQDPHEKLKKLPDIVRKLQGLRKYGPQIPTV